jgi:hypothetical protein
MGGGLMQLVAYGAQDIYLTGNPQITFFKVVYRRHTNFAVESIEQTFNGAVDFNKRVTATISRNGDLIKDMYLECVLPQLDSGNGGDWWVNSVGNVMIKKAEIEIGGQLIDRHYGEWMDIWSELTVPVGKKTVGYDIMVGNHETQAGVENNGLFARRLYVPLQFWFCRNPGLALPLIALQYHEVKLNLELRPSTDLVVGGTASMTSCKLYVDYVYLDTDERRRFAQVSHEYLIEQVQNTGDETLAALATSKNVTLNYNHPVKALYWVHVTSANAAVPTLAAGVQTGGKWVSYTGTQTTNSFGQDDSFKTAKLQLNGHDRFTVRNSDYFRLVQNYQHHTNVPNKHIYTYSFALSPEEHQPSGTCNFSRIDNATLQLKYEASAVASKIKMFAVNYNVLRIMSGMGGLAYSN